MKLCVIATAMNFEDATYAGESEFRTVLIYERVLHHDCLAKYAAAFFKDIALLSRSPKFSLEFGHLGLHHFEVSRSDRLINLLELLDPRVEHSFSHP